jgi:DNA-binding transcriptional LysR family regulator
MRVASARAARNMNIKQATLSRHIIGVGIILFDRKTRGGTLTPNGKLYLHTARRIVKEFEELTDWVRTTKNGKRTSHSIWESARQRGVGPVTAAIDLGYIKTILSHAAAVHDIVVSTESIGLARIALA